MHINDPNTYIAADQYSNIDYIDFMLYMEVMFDYVYLLTKVMVIKYMEQK